MERGGFDRPCVSEQYQREQAQREIAPKEEPRCRHGKTRLTCPHCYFRFNSQDEA